jgi:biopolymer transport protein TolQ
MQFISLFSSLKPFILAFKESDFIGKLIMLSLIGLSLLCWLIIIKKYQQFKLVKANKDQILSETLKLKNPLGPYEPQDKEMPFGALYVQFKSKTLDLLNKNQFFLKDEKIPVYLSETDINVIEQNVGFSIDESIKKLEKDFFILSTIVTLAPFLGLLGTVWGILMTFSELSGGAQAAQNSAVIGGLSMALATTVMGLVIAIPALIGYNKFKQELKSTNADLEDFLNKLLFQIELQYRKVNI